MFYALINTSLLIACALYVAAWLILFINAIIKKRRLSAVFHVILLILLTHFLHQAQRPSTLSGILLSLSLSAYLLLFSVKTRQRAATALLISALTLFTMAFALFLLNQR